MAKCMDCGKETPYLHDGICLGCALARNSSVQIIQEERTVMVDPRQTVWKTIGMLDTISACAGVEITREMAAAAASAAEKLEKVLKDWT